MFDMKVIAERKVIITWKYYQTLDDMKPYRTDKLQSVKYFPTFATTCSLTVTIVGDKSNLRPALKIPTRVYVKYNVATSAARLHMKLKSVRANPQLPRHNSISYTQHTTDW